MKTTRDVALLLREAAALFLLVVAGALSHAATPAGMISYWTFNDGTAADALGNNNGTIVGAPVVVPGRVGNALLFDGVDDGIVVPDSVSLNPTSITLELWVKYLSYKTSWFPRRNMLFDKRINGVGSYNLDYNGFRNPGNTGGWESDLNVAGTWSTYIQGINYQMPLGDWRHVVLAFDGMYVKLYENGALLLSWLKSGTLSPTATALYIAKPGHYLDSYSNAVIDEAAIYNRALTLGEVQVHYMNGLAGVGYVDYLAIAIDVRPGSTDNPINRDSRGKIPVAILSSATFDATMVDLNTVLFAGAPPQANSSTADVDGDGRLDLVLHFNVQETTLSDTANVAVLSGKTLDGMPFQGSDGIRLVK